MWPAWRTTPNPERTADRRDKEKAPKRRTDLRALVSSSTDTNTSPRITCQCRTTVPWLLSLAREKLNADYGNADRDDALWAASGVACPDHRADEAARCDEGARAPGSNAPAAVNKWHLFRTLTEIRAQIGIFRQGAVGPQRSPELPPETALSLGDGERVADELVVYPSNRQLSLRAHGMAEVNPPASRGARSGEPHRPSRQSERQAIRAPGRGRRCGSGLRLRPRSPRCTRRRVRSDGRGSRACAP